VRRRAPPAAGDRRHRPPSRQNHVAHAERDRRVWDRAEGPSQVVCSLLERV